MFPAPLPDAGSGDDRAHGVDIVECTIPTDMTIAQWRKTRATGAKAGHAPHALAQFSGWCRVARRPDKSGEPGRRAA
jgi:hypothetical protein